MGWHYLGNVRFSKCVPLAGHSSSKVSIKILRIWIIETKRFTILIPEKKIHCHSFQGCSVTLHLIQTLCTNWRWSRRVTTSTLSGETFGSLWTPLSTSSASPTPSLKTTLAWPPSMSSVLISRPGPTMISPGRSAEEVSLKRAFWFFLQKIYKQMVLM